MPGPLGNIMTVNPQTVMPPQPRMIGTPGIDARYREDQNIRAEQDQDIQMDRYGLEKSRAIADIANKEAFGSGLSGIVANPSLTPEQRRQQTGALAANTGQADLAVKMQDQDYQQKTKMEAQVLELAGNGNVAAAKHLAQQHGITLPEEVLNDGILSKGFAIGAKLYDYNPQQAGIFATKFKETGGDYNAALQAAGKPEQKPIQYAPSVDQIQDEQGNIYNVDKHTGQTTPTGIKGQPKANAYVPYNWIDQEGKPRSGRFNTSNGQIEEMPGVSNISKAGVPRGITGANGVKLSSYEVKIKLFEEAYKGDYADPTILRKAAIEHVDGGKPMDPVRLRQGAMRMILEQETIAGAPLYKTQAEREKAADEIVTYSLQQGATGTSASPPAATTSGAPTVAPATSPLGGVTTAAPPPPPGFNPE